jgi:predicted transcriptional regulator
MSSKMSNVKDMYQQVASDSHLVETVFSALSDNKSLSLFNIIGIMSSHASDGQPTGEILISRMNLTRRQYYTRINRLVDAGLITKKRARFVLTSLGSVVYETHKTIGIAIQNRWRLQVIDSLENTLITHGMPTEERRKLINTLLGNCDCDTVREILLSTVMPNK